MTTPDTPPIACTLAPGDYPARLAWIAKLAFDGLRSSERRDLVLELHYALEAADRVREMVRRERACCAFLTFDLQETSEEIQLIIRAPEEARGAVDMLFAVFASAAMKKTEKAARTAAPAVVLAGAGSILAWFAGAFAWMTGARPATSTLYLMAVATVLLAVALLWPLIEPGLRMALRR
jgi:hypothetical protein